MMEMKHEALDIKHWGYVAFRISVAIFILYSLFFIHTAPLMVAQAGSVSIQPAYPREGNDRTRHIFVHEVIPESLLQEGVTVINDGTTPQLVRVYAADYQPSNGGGFACEQYAEEDDGVASWINVEQEEVLVPAGSIDIIQFTIRVPENVGVGEHNACILVEPILENPERNAGGFSVSTRNAIRVALLVPGDLTKAIQVKDFSFIKEGEGTFFLPTLRNVGSVSADVDIVINVRTLFGQKISAIGGTFALLRDITREFRLEMPERPILGGWYTAEVQAKYDPDPNTVVGIRDEDNFVTASTAPIYFFLMPQPVGSAILLITLLLVIGIIFERRSAFNRKYKVAATWVIHTVVEGDSIEGIAQAQNISWRVLVRANKLRKPYAISKGQEILVPPSLADKGAERSRNTG